MWKDLANRIMSNNTTSENDATFSDDAAMMKSDLKDVWYNLTHRNLAEYYDEPTYDYNETFGEPSFGPLFP